MLLTAAQYTENCGGHRSKSACNKQHLLHTRLLLPEKQAVAIDSQKQYPKYSLPLPQIVDIFPEETHSFLMGERKLPENRQTEMEPLAGLPSPAALLK